MALAPAGTAPPRRIGLGGPLRFGNEGAGHNAGVDASRLVGLVLAGGRGRRMGRPKGSLVHEGGTLASRAAAALARVADEVLVATAPHDPNPAPGFPAIEDGPPAGRGPLAGIASGFAARPGADLLVLACDYPRVETDLLRALAARAAAIEADVVLLADGAGRDHPLVAVWRSTAAAAVERSVALGSLRVSDLVDSVRAIRVGPGELPAHDLDRALVNWNRPEDLGEVRYPRVMAGRGHLDDEGRASMVDVGAKAHTDRRATAEGTLQLGSEAFELLRDNRLAKGDALAVARLAGVQAAKRTADWIPLCHPVPLEHVEVGIELDAGSRTVRVTASARARWSTGVEMEALVAVSAACLALYDMTKGIDRAAEIGPVRLVSKEGGRSGSWSR
jgi:cyclic pyranopterin phosphate synthase